jgi:hypothetical protein
VKYFPRLKIWKSGKNNEFDGTEARSYGWYVYAFKLTTGEFIGVERHYSSTTMQHMYKFSNQFVPRPKQGRLFDYEILAPGGLSDLQGAERAIAAEIAKLQAELANPRNRVLQARRDRIAKLQGMYKTIAMLKADLARSRKSIASRYPTDVLRPSNRYAL